MSSTEHDYVRYTRGCRCDVCRRAKADYMADRRASARAKAQERGPGPYVAPIQRHGTRAGYEEHGCRCLDCSRARAESDRRRWRRRSMRMVKSGEVG